MKKFAYLTSVLALTACGGGSGGDAGRPGSIIVPDNINRTANTVDSDSGLSMIDINATRSENVSQAIRIAQSIENENAGIDYGASIDRGASKAKIAKLNTASISQQDIDKAYETMHDIFVNHNYSGYTNHDVLVALALIYMDKAKILSLLGQENNKLDEKIDVLIDGLNAGDDFAKDAQDIYQDFGKEFKVTLNNAQFEKTIDGRKFTFLVDEKGNVESMSTVGNDDEKHDSIGGGRFKQDVTNITTYYVEFTDDDTHELGTDENGKPNSISGSIDFAEGENPSSEEVRNGLLTALKEKYFGDEKTLEGWLAEVEIKRYDESCSGNCIKFGPANYSDIVSIETKGRDLGLKYSDFGLLIDTALIRAGTFDEGDIITKDITYKEHGVFAGGYDAQKANAPTVENNDKMEFVGASFAGVTRKSNNFEEDLSDYEEPDINFYNGSSKLIVSGTQDGISQKLVADFSDAGWYTVTVDNLGTNNKTIDFATKENQTINDKYVVAKKDNNNYVGIVENNTIKYYGPTDDNPTEVVGFVQYVERDEKATKESDWTFKADISFGAKKQ